MNSQRDVDSILCRKMLTIGQTSLSCILRGITRGFIAVEFHRVRKRKLSHALNADFEWLIAWYWTCWIQNRLTHVVMNVLFVYEDFCCIIAWISMCWLFFFAVPWRLVRDTYKSCHLFFVKHKYFAIMNQIQNMDYNNVQNDLISDSTNRSARHQSHHIMQNI